MRDDQMPFGYQGSDERAVLERLANEEITTSKAVELLRELGVGRLPPGGLPSYEGIADMLPSILASSSCPLCGRSGFHEHSPQEIVIYRNGVKYGQSLTGSGS